jgi:hypothetical protein
MNTKSWAELNWINIASELGREGYALLPGLFDSSEIKEIALALCGEAETVTQQCAGAKSYSQGGSIPLTAELPETLTVLRENCYRHLQPLAAMWRELMGMEAGAASSEQACDTQVYGAVQTLGEHEYQVLTQNPNTQFPVQLVMLLSEPGTDFTGGQFVMTEQRPRMQSRPIVVPLAIGDVAIIATAHRPFKGSKGYYRVNMKHAVSRVRSGKRLGLELLLDHSSKASTGG